MKILTANIITLTLFILISCGSNRDKADVKSIDSKTLPLKEQKIDTKTNNNNHDRIDNKNINSNPPSLKEQEANTKTNSDDSDKIAITYTNIPNKHISSDNGITYEVNVGFDSEKTDRKKRKDFFYKSQETKTVIYDSWLQYRSMNGFYPCSPTCNTKLFAHTEQGIKSLENIELVVDSQDVCGRIEPLKWVNHKKIEPKPLFITTMDAPNQTSFIDAKDFKVEHPPEWMSLDDLSIPKGAKNKKVNLYKYGENSDAYIAEVQAIGWIETVDADKFGPSREGIWQGVYFVDKDQSLIITPIKHRYQSYYGEDFSVRGFEGINGDGYLDIILGSPVSLILESYKQGFRSWGFAFFPPGGC